MDFANGTVKKYSREYTRTLKDGKKKKYKTEQVQVTVPKAENIFDDGEDVILIRKTDFNDFEDIEEIKIALEFFNLILTENNKFLNDELDKNKEIIEEFESQINDCGSNDVVAELESELDSKNLTIKDLNLKMDSFKDELLSKDALISDLKETLNNSDNSDNNLVDSISRELNNDSTNKDYIELQKDFIKLSKKFELMQEELFNLRVNSLYYKNLANKYRKFILKLE